MKRLTLLFIAVFCIISYKSIIHFSKDEHADLVDSLQTFTRVDCPAGVSLYRLQTPLEVYRIQVQEKLPHNPSQRTKLLKRCEVESLKNHSTRRKALTNDKSPASTDVFQIPANDEYPYQTVDAMTLHLLRESCDVLGYGTEEFALSINKRLPLQNTVAANAFLLYMLQIVKGPEPLTLSEYKTDSDTWSFNILAHGIFPGTLWCGFGNMADDIYDQVGDHSETDLCCRSHDLCKPIIKAFETRYFYSNPGVLPISHCGCDMDLYNCLIRADSPTSRTIGKIFFNLVKMKCFDFDVREVCTSSFLGLCRETQNRCVAVLKSNKWFPE